MRWTFMQSACRTTPGRDLACSDKVDDISPLFLHIKCCCEATERDQMPANGETQLKIVR